MALKTLKTLKSSACPVLTPTAVRLRRASCIKKGNSGHWLRRCLVRRRQGRPESQGFHARIRKGRWSVAVFLKNIFVVFVLLCKRPSVECLRCVLAVMSQSARCSYKYDVRFRRLPSSSVPFVCYMFPRKGPGPLLAPPTPRQRFLIPIV